MYVGSTQATRAYFTKLKYDEKSVAEIIDKYLGENLPTANTDTDTSDTDNQFARANMCRMLWRELAPDTCFCGL
jgi:hypothetical protein